MTSLQAAPLVAFVAYAFFAAYESDEADNAFREAAVEALMRASRFYLLGRPLVSVDEVTAAGEAAFIASVAGRLCEGEVADLAWRAFIVAAVAKADELAAKKVA